MKNYLKTNMQTYDFLAEEYKNRKKNYEISDRKIMQSFIDYLKNNFKKAHVLELGPGSGLALQILSEEGFNTTAIDISKKMIKISKEASPNTEYIHSDFLEYDFGKVKYEGIFAKAFIHLFPKEDAVLVIKKMMDILAPNGIIFIGTTLHENPEEGFIKKEGYPNEPERFRKKWTKKELEEIIKKLSLKIISKKLNFEKEKNKTWIKFLLNKKELKNVAMG
jgi:SAM-dependent methyltransferase